MMKHLIIHAGLPKTGTSALQVFLAGNHSHLRRQSIDYFQLGEFEKGGAGQISSGNGFHIARSLLPAGDGSATKHPELHFAALNKAIAASPCETGLLSSEYFADCDPARLQNWVAGLAAAGITAKLVYFIRAQDQLVSSMYVQYVKRSHCRETPEGYAGRVYRTVPYLKHASFYKTLRAIFGAENITCRVYEAAMKTRNGLCLDFLAAIGASPLGLSSDTRDVNLGLSGAQLAIMRELNKYRPHTRLSDQMVHNAGMAGAAAGETYNLLSPAMTAEIRAYFAAENAEIAALVFDGADPFPAGARDRAEIADLDEIPARELVNVLGGLLVRYDERIAHLEAHLQHAANRPWRRLARKLAAASRGVARLRFGAQSQPAAVPQSTRLGQAAITNRL
jgi:hypothetical protein